MAISPLEIRHLRSLLALRDTGSLSRAGQLVHLTQSALSHQIKLLEAYFGSPLFVRKTTPLLFTPAGQRLLDLAEEVLQALSAAERDIFSLSSQAAGRLRIAVECHTCFDWLMPSMDRFRQHWPDVELDIVSGFHADPVGLLHQDEAELAIVAECASDEPAIHFAPLFAFDILALLSPQHALSGRSYLQAEDFVDETLITYPVPDDMIDVVRKVLRPAGINPPRRSSELTVAILQLVASGRGIAALPSWAVAAYVERGYVRALPITRSGLSGELYAASRLREAPPPYMRAFVDIMREVSFTQLPGVRLLP